MWAGTGFPRTCRLAVSYTEVSAMCLAGRKVRQLQEVRRRSHQHSLCSNRRYGSSDETCEVNYGNHDIELMAHLMRRAGFGAKRDELEARAAKGYDATVDELVDYGEVKTIPEDLIRRYHPDAWGKLGRSGASFNCCTG